MTEAAALDFFVGIDLAERFSAAVCIGTDGEPVFETLLDTGAAEKPARPAKHIEPMLRWWYEIIELLNHHAAERGIADASVLFVVENVHHRAVNYMPVARLQGSLLTMMCMAGVEPHLITAIEWQRYFGYSKKEHGTSKKWAKSISEEFGYEPGQTLPGTKLLAKPKTDLRDAYLLARWLREICNG